MVSGETKIPVSNHQTSAKLQYLFALVVNLLLLSYGISCGWPSPNTFLLQTKDSPLDTGPITDDESSWIASFFSIGRKVGTVFFTFITNRFSRKRPLLAIAFPNVISWALILFARNVYFLYVARLLNGFVGGGIFVIVPGYFAEVASDSVRGLLGSTIILSCNIGILLAFILGHFTGFVVTPIIVIAITVVYVIGLYFFPESPTFLMKQNMIPETEDSIRFYQSMRRNTADYALLQMEITKLENTLGNSPAKKMEADEKSRLQLSDLTRRPGSKAMIIGIVLALLNQFCGCFALLSNTAYVFKIAGSSLHPNISAIVVGAIQLIGSYAPTLLVERLGRKLLFVISTIGVALGLITLGIYMMLKTKSVGVDAFNWIPLASFSFTIFIASWAILTLPFLVISEVLPDKIKDFGTSFCMTVLWTSQFIILKFLTQLNDAIGFHGTLFIFAGVCIACTVFILSYIPETKGKSYDEIMKTLQ